MKVLLMSIFLLSIPVGFISTILYFSCLFDFRKCLAEIFPAEWNDFSKSSFPKTKSQQAYEAFTATRTGFFMSKPLPKGLLEIRKKVQVALFIGALCFLSLIVSIFLIEGIEW